AGAYELFITDLSSPKHGLVVDGTGHGEVEFKTPADGSKPLFDFPVFDQLMEVRQGATVFFSDTFGGAGGGGGGGVSGDNTRTEAFMVNVGPDFNAQGRLRYEAKGSKTKFSVEVEKLDAGTYTLLVAGSPVGELVTTGPASVELEFQSPVEPGKTLLNFDPLGAQVDVTRDGVTWLTGVLAGANSSTGTKPPGKAAKGCKDLGKGKADALLVFLANTGLLSGAQGTAKLAQGGETEWEVELEHVPAGSYGLAVNGAPVGTLVADGTGHAQLDFSTSPGNGVLDLSFAVKGQLVEISSGSGVILSAVFPMSVQAALGSFSQETFKAGKVKVNLVNAGVDLDARGTATWKLAGSGGTQLLVQVQDLPAGSYRVQAVKDSVTTVSAAALVVSAQGKGKLVLASVPKGSALLLDLDPVGALLQVTDDLGAVLLQASLDVP
ncbi:MAG TPA: hypothetical protein VK824_11405, partial [Planctomycetota bacterium]|nr:hypothetical protein [Planctomycetota bacterium]